MSKYQKEIDFITRTRAIFNVAHEYKRTLLLNCCVGLLIMPQQSLNRNNSSSPILGDVDELSWGIIETDISLNEHKKGATLLSVENIAYHFRNSIAHYRFDIIKCNEHYKDIQKIHIKDAYDDNPNSPLTFDLEMTFDNFQKFVIKYSDELLNILKNI